MLLYVLAAAGLPLALGELSYSYADAPTAAPTETMAPTRAETYAPTRMTEAPSYAPTTDTYAPSFGSCPMLVPDPDTCPADPSGLPLCSAVGLSTGDKCITGPQICPDQPGPTNCPAFQVARRLLKKIHGPITRAFHGWTQRQFKKTGEEPRRRLAAPDECTGADCYVAQVGDAEGPTAVPSLLPTAAPVGATADPTAEPTPSPVTSEPSPGPSLGPTPAPSTPMPSTGPTPAPTTPDPSTAPTPAPTTPMPSPGPTLGPTTPMTPGPTDPPATCVDNPLGCGIAPPGGGTSCNNFPALVPSFATDTDCTVNTTCVITLTAQHGNMLPGDYYGTCFTAGHTSATVETCNCCEPTNVAPNLPTDQGPLYISFLGICGGEWCADTGVSGGVGGQSVYTELPVCTPVAPPP